MTDFTAERIPQNPGKLDGSVLFYKNPEPLSPEAHGKLGANQLTNPYAFVAQSHVVPLTVTEFASAALSYPVIFLGDSKQPVAVMGLRQTENLFVNEAGEFRPEAYLPAYVRRYPFVFANDPSQDRMILCIDRDAAFLSEGGQAPLFADGKPTDYVNKAMEFCSNFEQERVRTENFVKLLTDLDLFTVREANFTPRNERGEPGQPQKLAEYFAVSEEKLNALPAEKLVELRDNGALGQIYAHLLSLVGWDKLIALAFARAAEQQKAPAGNA
ncbi:SapC family protein [Brevundimonas sp.]|uniref:SapC family protein n=1 Tax=Brevundimonas sp. TaxID=1871086 RepID=UPI003BA853F2